VTEVQGRATIAQEGGDRSAGRVKQLRREGDRVAGRDQMGVLKNEFLVVLSAEAWAGGPNF